MMIDFVDDDGDTVEITQDRVNAYSVKLMEYYGIEAIWTNGIEFQSNNALNSFREECWLDGYAIDDFVRMRTFRQVVGEILYLPADIMQYLRTVESTATSPSIIQPSLYQTRLNRKLMRNGKIREIKAKAHSARLANGSVRDYLVLADGSAIPDVGQPIRIKIGGNEYLWFEGEMYDSVSHNAIDDEYQSISIGKDIILDKATVSALFN